MQDIVGAAQGKAPADTIIKNVTYLDVFSGQWQKGDVAIFGSVVIGLEPGLKANQTIDGKGKWLVPGFVDAHVHVESSMMVPEHFGHSVIKNGTTTAICDPHEIANVAGYGGLHYFLQKAYHSKINMQIMLSSCVPATHLETNGAGEVGVKTLLNLYNDKEYMALGLAEVMNVPGVLNNDPKVVEKLEAFEGLPIDGHSPLLRGKELSAYAATGISSCHESSQLDEAQEKLTKGMAVWIREGSVAKDLDELLPLLNMATSSTLGFCTDDRNPLDIAEEGHIDFMVRKAIEKGVAPEVVYRTASWSPARHYGLDRNRRNKQGEMVFRVGAIAPGYSADLILLDDMQTCSINQVFRRGIPISEMDLGNVHWSNSIETTVFAETPEEKDLEGPKGQVHVIDVTHGKIITDRHVDAHDAKGVSRLTVLERHGHKSPPANAYVSGFGQLNGAIASSVGHDSHNLIVVGNNTKDMKVALNALIDFRGGFCVVSGGKVLAQLELHVGGLMSQHPPEVVTERLRELKAASKTIGCQLPEPFLQLAFLSLPVIPSLKLTDKGLVDVDQFKIIDVRAS